MSNNSLMTSDQLITPKTNTNTLVLNDHIINCITNNPNAKDDNELITGEALFFALRELNDKIGEIDPNNNIFKDKTVISETLIGPSFYENEEWEILNFHYSNGKALYVGNIADNYVKIPNKILTDKGYYFIVIDISRMDSGRLELQDRSGNVIQTYTSSGKFYKEVLVSNSDIDLFKLVAKDVRNSEVIEINTCNFHRVTSRIRDYLTYTISEVASGGIGGFATQEYVNQLVAQTVIDLKAYVDSKIGLDLDEVLIHIHDRSNPHGVTPEQIGAADRDHTHTPQSIGAAAETHTHTPEECNAAPANHGHTPSSIGAVDLTTYENEIFDIRGILENLTSGTVSKDDLDAAMEQIYNKILQTLSQTMLPVLGAASMFGVAYSTEHVQLKGDYPDWIDVSQLTKPISSLVFKHLWHDTTTNISYGEGSISTSLQTYEGNLADIIRVPITEYEYNNRFAKFDAPSTADPILFSYEFCVPRYLSALEFSIDHTGNIKGRPSSIEIFADDMSLGLMENIDWTQPVSFPLTGIPITDSVQYITIRVNSVDMNGGDKWTFRVHVIFGDTEEFSVRSGVEIMYPLTKLDGRLLHDLEKYEYIVKTVDIPEEIKTFNNEIFYVRVSYGADPNSNSGGTSTGIESILNDLRFIPVDVDFSPIRPEFSYERMGVPEVLGRFDNSNQSYLGTLTSIPEYASINNIYKDNQDCWTTDVGIKTATVIHTLPTNFDIGLASYELMFTEAQKISEVIPEQWVLEVYVTDVDGNDAWVTLDDVSKFVPIKRRNGSYYYRQKLTDNIDLGIVKYIHKIRLTMTTTKDNGIGVCKFIPYFTIDFFDIGKKRKVYQHFKMSTSKLETDMNAFKSEVAAFYEGAVKYITTDQGISGFKLVRPFMLDDVIVMPCNEAYPVDMFGNCTIPNPYPDSNIEINVIADDIDGSPLNPIANVTEVTNDYITLNIKTNDIFRLVLKKNW